MSYLWPRGSEHILTILSDREIFAQSVAELALGSLVVVVLWGCHVFASKLASDVHGLFCLVDIVFKIVQNIEF